MAWFLFIDESGQDHVQSPYEVLAGVAVKDADLWPLVRDLHSAEESNFGRRYTNGTRELKAKKILKTKTFHHSELNAPLTTQEIRAFACACLDDGAINNSVKHLRALALAKLSYAQTVLDTCKTYNCAVIASMCEAEATQTNSDGLRKDYGYLFERFYYFLEDQSNVSGHKEQGILVFDELEKSKSHILIDQAHRYFKATATGRARASLIVPEPFFVHSDLSTSINLVK